jgi:beta-lactam-binding protein with PASTA domain
MAEQIFVFCSEDGEMTVEMEGFVGHKCSEVAKELEARGLGKIRKDVKKPAYYQKQTNANKVSNGRR